ncbi:hypothetical protein D3C85_1380510 [compost metagenome]
MKYFDFALRAVTYMHGNAAILRIQSSFFVAASKFLCGYTRDGAIIKVENIELYVVQQAVRRDLCKSIHVALAR